MTLAVREIHHVGELGTDFKVNNLDALECWAQGFHPAQAIALSIEASEACFLYSVDGAPLCAWGYRTRGLLDRVADVWLLGTDEVAAHPVAFARRSKHLLAHLHSDLGFRRLLCHVWEGHRPATKWLGWLGFSVYAVQGTFLHMQRTAT